MSRRRILVAAVVLVATGCGRPPMGGVSTAVESLMVQGERLYFAAEYDSARVSWERARALAKDSAIEARVLTWYGLIAYRRGDYDSARAIGERALALKLRHNFTSDYFRSYNALGLLAWNEGRLTAAGALFDSAASAARRLGNDSLLAAVFGNIGLVETEFGDFDGARASFERAREFARRAGAARAEGNATNNLGMLLIRVGEPAGAIPSLTEALAAYRRIGYPTGEQQALGQLGTAYAALGDLSLATAYLDTALTLSREQELRQEEASNLEAIAALYRDAGDLRRALELYAQARAIDAELGLATEEAADLRAEAEILVALGDPAAASRRLGNALMRHRRMGARLEVFFDLLLLARVAGERSDAAGARRWLLEARRLTDSLGTANAATALALAEAEEAERRGAPAEVLRALSRDSSAFQRIGFERAARASALRARAHLELGLLAEAEGEARSAVARSEGIREGLPSPFLRAAFAVERVAMYATLADVLRRQGRVAEAFAAADASRGRALREGLGDSEVARAERLVLVLDSLERLEPDERAEYAEREAAVRARLERLRAARAALAHEGTDPVSVAAALRPGEALISYLVAPRRSSAFVVTREGVRAVDLPVDGLALIGRVRVARELVGREGGASELPALEALEAALVEPIRQAGLLDGISRLVVVPHGPLIYLPFAALRSSRTGRFLVEDFVLRVVPSAGALPEIERRAAASRVAPTEGAAFAPFTRELPGTAEEVAALASRLRRVRRYEGGAASEARLRGALANMPLVHIASHGTLNHADVLGSRLELASGTGSSGDDGRLEVREVLALEVRSELVFLSGCETGLGGVWETALGRGDDLATLGQAFLYAGARSVVATLWRIPDRAAADFARRFYGHYPGVWVAEAVALAQRDMLRDPRYARPLYWAAYLVAGAGEVGPRSQSSAAASVSPLSASHLHLAGVVP